MAANVVLSFNQIPFESACYSSLSGIRIHYRKLCSGEVTVVSTPVQHSRWTRIKKLYHVNDHQSANRVGDGSVMALAPCSRLRNDHCRNTGGIWARMSDLMAVSRRLVAIFAADG